MRARAVIPSACVGTSGCASYATTTHQQFSWLTLACSVQSGQCVCDLAADIGVSNESGHYAPTAEGFTLTPSAGVAESYVAGVGDDSLVMRGDDTARAVHEA